MTLITDRKKRTLVIHPIDRTTDFLEGIYRNLDVEVIRGNVSKRFLLDKIRNTDQVFLLGHGTPDGLFGSNTENFLKVSSEDTEMLDEIRKKDVASLFVFCYASLFARENRLRSFSTGMFISEDYEAAVNGFIPDHGEVESSNSYFVDVVGNALLSPSMSLDVFYKRVKDDYSVLCGGRSKVGKFNSERFYSYDTCSTDS